MVKLITFIRLSFVGAVFVQFTSCGLKYTQVESPEAFRERRLNAIESYCAKEFQRIGATYTSIQFSESSVAKPIQYKSLDSLFALKYALEKQGKTDSFLDEQIRLKREALKADSLQAKYLEKHLFSVRERDSITYYYCTFQLNKQLTIEDMRIEQSVHIPMRDDYRYSLFLSEEPLLANAYTLSPKEQSFYSYYKSQAEQLTGKELDRFMGHIMHTIEIAQLIQSVDPRAIGEQIIRQHLYGKSYKQRKEQFNWTPSPPTEWRAENTGYTVEYVVDQPITTTEEESHSVYRFTFDPYFQLVRKTVIK